MKPGDDGSGNTVCLCPDGTSIPHANGTCPQKDGHCTENQFQCSNKLCIAEKWKCEYGVARLILSNGSFGQKVCTCKC